MIETELMPIDRRVTTAGMKGAIAALLVIGAGAATSGCITVNAPDKPIEINLNIKIDQEVVYRLDGEAKSLIQDNPGIF